MSSSTAHVSARELVELLHDGRAGEELGAAVGSPVVVVDGSAPAATPHERAAVQRAAALVGSLPCVLLAAADADPDLAPLIDAYVDDDALVAVAAQVAIAPVASVSLAVLLRASERRTIDDGLATESAVYSMLQGGPEFASWRATRARRAPKPTDEPVLLVDRAGPALHLTLNRPGVHNAWSVALRDAFVEALQLALADPSIDVIELRGAGRSFCSGGDLDEFGSFPDPPTGHVVRLARSPARLLALLGDRVVSHLHGACMGAGVELPAFGRRVVADDDTVIALPELALGLVPGAGGTVSLPRRIGRHRTALLALSGMRIDAPTALAWGLVDELVSSTGSDVE